MAPQFTDNGYNASSLHAEGRRAKAALDDARARIARQLGARAREIIFTGSGSESNNLAILGAARTLRNRGRHVVSTAIEHHAVLHAFDALREEGFEVTLLSVDSDGRVDARAFAAALRPDTVLASVGYVNNELGVVAPIEELAAIAHGRGVLFHTDAVQAPAYMPLDARELGVDLLSICAHKLSGPKGMGALYVRAGVTLAPLLYGGTQEYGVRPGTENVAGAVGMAVALDLARAESAEAGTRVRALRERFEQALLGMGDVRINGGGAPRAPHITNAAFKGVVGEQLLIRLDVEGIAASAGSACASGVMEPSHVVAALGLEREWISAIVRFSFARTTTQPEVDSAAAIVIRSVEHLRSFSSTPT